MLSKSLYDLCLLLSTPYEKLNLFSNNIYALDSFILEEIYLMKLFNFKWRKKLNSSFNNFKFDYSYETLEQNMYFIKLKLNLKICFIVQNSQSNILSACIHEYIVILEHLHNAFKIKFLIEDEENPFLYSYVLNTDLSEITNLIFSKNQSLWTNKISSIDLLYETFMTSGFFSNNNNIQNRSSNFNVTEACAYAETFALNPNPNYKYFEDIGGDCTNFASQILYAGGIKQTKAWIPYTNPWVRVEDLYLYLTTQKLGTKLPNEN